MTADEVIQEITRRAWSFGVAVLMSPESNVDNDGLLCGGWFCGEEKKLVVATGREQDKWLGVLVHEYCHLTQWIEDTPLWHASKGDNVHRWLAGESVRGIRKQIASVQAMEADCERRAVRMIKELKVPVDLDKYIRGANAYIHFHNVMADQRKWFAEGKSPYLMPKVLAACNPTLDLKFDKTPLDLYDELMTCL